MTEVTARIQGKAGRITLARPQALNALTHAMCQQIEAAIDGWRNDPAVALVIIDAEGDRAFCAGGDVAAVWRASTDGDPSVGRDFWRDEYRLNAKLAEYPKPIIALMQGFVMGGGVGIGCHVSHRVVAETVQMAMPEAVIGLIPDVGGTLLLARAPGYLGRYLGLTAVRMGPGDTIHGGFADHFVPRDRWTALIDTLCVTGDATAVLDACQPAPASQMAHISDRIDAAFGGADLASIAKALRVEAAPWAAEALAAMDRNSPLSMAATLALLDALSPDAGIREALSREFRFTSRAAEPGLTDFLEGVRAQLIDKDRQPRWRNQGPEDVDPTEVAALIAPLGEQELRFQA